MKRLLILAVFIAPSAAVAHPAHATGDFAGLLHPLTGPDHLLAMLGVGLWATQQTQNRLALPLTFLTAMVAGFAAASLGLTLPAFEPLILASVILLGAATAMALRASLTIALQLIILFGLAHGAAHGSEGAGPTFALGMLAATAALHATGAIFGMTLNRRMMRLAGGATLIAGVGLAITG